MTGCTLLIEAHDGRVDAGAPSGDGGVQDAAAPDGSSADAAIDPVCMSQGYELEIHPGAGGSMTVFADGVALDCPENTTCNTCVLAGTELTIVPTPKSGYQFSNWSTGCASDCVGMNPCVVLMPATRYVCLATFKQ